MSLPTAPRDISEHPRAGAVTDPVNKQQKDADVDRKVCRVILVLGAGSDLCSFSVA